MQYLTVFFINNVISSSLIKYNRVGGVPRETALKYRRSLCLNPGCGKAKTIKLVIAASSLSTHH